VSDRRGITDLERLTRPGGKVLPDDETIPVLTERLVLPSLEIDTSLPQLATTAAVAPDRIAADTAATHTTAPPAPPPGPDDDVVVTVFPMPTDAPVDVEALLPPPAAPWDATRPPAPVLRASRALRRRGPFRPAAARRCSSSRCQPPSGFRRSKAATSSAWSCLPQIFRPTGST